MVITTGAGPQSKVITPPFATARTTFREVQLAGVPCPTTWSGRLVLAGCPAFGTGTCLTPRCSGCRPAPGVADVAVEPAYDGRTRTVAVRTTSRTSRGRRIRPPYGSRGEPVHRPAVPVTPVDEAVVHPTRPPLPELHLPWLDPEATPLVRNGHVVRVRRVGGRPGLVQLVA